MSLRSFVRHFSIILVLLVAAAPAWAEEAAASESGEAEDDKDKKEDPVYGDTVVVTASKTAEEVRNAPVAVTVIR